jgi:Na+-transporting NADH:ubiquinone oxidoreductase subunit NqrC
MEHVAAVVGLGAGVVLAGAAVAAEPAQHETGHVDQLGLDSLRAVELVVVRAAPHVDAAIAVEHLGQAVDVRVEVREASPDAGGGSTPCGEHRHLAGA